MPRTDSERSLLLQKLPAVDRLVQFDALRALPRRVVTRAAREVVDELRRALLGGTMTAEGFAAACADDAIAAAVVARCTAVVRRRHERVFNATGIVLHTGIGRAPLAAAAVAAVTGAAGYTIVEVDPQSGERDQRELAVDALLRELTGAEAALVVNNNAAATTLMLAALCAEREVVISRGELVEIGGGFRMPDVMRRAGCVMVEVGATNKTHLGDFVAATSAATVAWLKVHPSNFRIEGFASQPGLAELSPLARERGLLLLDDVGSGLLHDAPLKGLEHEPRVRERLRLGADVVCFSGDKLLGGPQSGLLIGRREAIVRCRAHPLYRALRCDKLTLAALEATLLVYRDGDPEREVPALRMLSARDEELHERATGLAQRLSLHSASVVRSDSFAGSGANPARPLPSFATALPGGERTNAALRAARPIAVFARVHDGQVLLDARTLLLEDLDVVAAAVAAALSAT